MVARGFLGLLLLGSPAMAQSFQLLGDLPGGEYRSAAQGVSANGAVVVGVSWSANGTEAFRWSPWEGMIGLGDLPGGAFNSEATAVSGDGSVVVGIGTSAVGTEAFWWTSASGMVGLGALPGHSYSEATGISADGSIVVGFSSDAIGTVKRAFVWTAANGMIDPGVPPGFTDSEARGISLDGKVIVGVVAKLGQASAFRLTTSKGFELVPGCSASTQGFAISGDGEFVVGAATCMPASAFRWSKGTGYQSLGQVPGGIMSKTARAASFDCSVIVGEGMQNGVEAFVWDTTDFLKRLDDGLVKAGATIPPNVLYLIDARGLSADGTVVVGEARLSNSIYEAYRATFAPKQCLGDLNGDMRVCQSDLGIMLAAFGMCVGQTGYNPTANIVTAGGSANCVDQADLGVLLSEYATCGVPCTP